MPPRISTGDDGFVTNRSPSCKLSGRSAEIHALEWWLVSPGHEDGDVIEVL
jgi:hypothetical protein